jgi:hypothetical protein
LNKFVVPLAHIAPPSVFDVPLEFDSEWAVVPETVESTIDLAGLKHESTSLA